MRPIIVDKCAKLFRDHCLNRSREILPEGVGCGIFDSYFRYNFRPEVDNDAVSGVHVYYVGLDIRVKLGDYRSNGSRDTTRKKPDMTRPTV